MDGTLLVVLIRGLEMASAPLLLWSVVQLARWLGLAALAASLVRVSSPAGSRDRTVSLVRLDLEVKSSRNPGGGVR